MKSTRQVLTSCSILAAVLGFAWACPFDSTLREYLNAHFWLPFAKHMPNFERPNVRRISAPFAGMKATAGATPLAKLRTAYQAIAKYDTDPFDVDGLKAAVAAARADRTLTSAQREEVDLVDAKVDLRAGYPYAPHLVAEARRKLIAFLQTARTPELLSEARGWLARAHRVSGDQAAAGKIYLDELNRDGSNLSRDTLLNSLRITYGYDGGPKLIAQLEQYFDTPEHAAFAIQLATNPRRLGATDKAKDHDHTPPPYGVIKQALEKHRGLLRTGGGAAPLVLLLMRTALREGDPPYARKVAAEVAANDPVRAEPDFQWMLAAAHFLSRNYALAEAPLLAVFQSARSSEAQKAAAAYGLCGVYRKTAEIEKQLQMALWLRAAAKRDSATLSDLPGVSDMSIYWAGSGWDLGLLLEVEAPISALRAMAGRILDGDSTRLVKYSLAVRLARENQYEEAAAIYQSLHAAQRAGRMRELAARYRKAMEPGLSAPARHQAQFNLAEYLGANTERLYFNDLLWNGLQSYVFQGSTDVRLTRAERQQQMERERKLKDEQEERWRAYLILRGVVREAGKSEMGRKAATLGLRCLRRIHERFERRDEIRKADFELTKFLRS